MIPRWGFSLAFCLALSACASAGQGSAPATTPSPTTAPGPVTAEPTEDPPPGATPAPLTDTTPAIVLEPPIPIPTATLAVPPVNLPLERLSILRPGPGSQVRSPFQMIGRGGPSFNERVEIRLLGEDGRTMGSWTTILFAFPGNAGRFVVEVSFDTNLVAEEARLEVQTFDRRYGRPDQITTVNLIALSAGRPRIHPAFEGPEKLAILSPRDGQAVSGGLLMVEGAGWVDADVPLTIEVLDREGRVVGSTQARLDAPAVGQLGTFQAEVPYQVPFGQYGRLAVSEPSTGIPGLVHYSSIEVFLEP